MSSSRFVLESDNTEVPQVPKLKAVKPFGSTILVEMLNADEALGTKIIVNKDVSVGAPQAYVLALGSKLVPGDVDLKVGDRVMLQGSYVPIPNFDKNRRQRGIVELHNVKAVLEEDAVLDEE
jgi:co-chaperonin GroES (HSP10)